MTLKSPLEAWNSRLGLALLVLAILTGAGLGLGYYQYGKTSFIARKSEEKATVLNLVSAFVSTYSEQRAMSDAHNLPVPATFRAMALESFNKSSDIDVTTRVEMVGVPGLEISNAAKDQHAADIITSMAASQSKQVWSNLITMRGTETLRAIKPVIASSESCVSCHNRLQEGVRTWQIGDVMGAFVFDTPAAAYFAGLWRISAMLGFLGFGAIAVTGMVLGKLHRKINQAEQRQVLQLERESMLEQARCQAEEDARGLSRKVQRFNEELVSTNRKLLGNLHELKAAQDEIIKSGKMALLGQLIATVAHEIRNPLGVISTSLAILERKAASAGADLDKPIVRIKNSVERCDTIVNELLDFSRSKSLDLVDCDVDAWLEKTVSEHSERIHRDVAIECHLGLDGLEASFDQSRVDRAVCNLISNAAEAMAGKIGKPLENPTVNAKVVISTRLSARGIEFCVRDNGPGISAENIQKIFDPLFTTKSFGVGLGLPAVKKIFEQHGGDLDVDSVPGEGAVFTGWIRADLRAGEEEAA
jgi:signal transduction histidine kinase